MEDDDAIYIWTGSGKRDIIDRHSEIARLRSNFAGLVPTILISPRRWGKTSLVHHVARSVISRKHRFCHLNLQRIQSEHAFYEALITAVSRATTTKTQDVIAQFQEFLGKIQPSIRMGVGGVGFDIKLQLGESTVARDDILDFPQHIARRKNIRITLCIDGFQDLSQFEEPLQFQRRLRASWQHHDKVGYCLYGSKKHMMYDIFENQDMPFYKFGDLLFLNKIGREHWIPFITRAFSNSKKSIAEEHAIRITEWMQDHPYYVQYFSHLVWTRTKSTVTEDILAAALRELFNQHIIHYERIVDGLTSRQVNFLRAVINKEQALYSREVINTYDLGTSSSVTTVKTSLMQKEILDEDANGLYFQDPPFGLWLDQDFFAPTY